MTDTAAAPVQSTRRRWWLVVLAVGVVIAVGATALRAALWPCGAFDRTSGCVSSVALDVASLGLDPDKTLVETDAIDLGPDAQVALVGLTTPTDSGLRVVLALFDARTGQPIRSLADGSSARFELWIGEVALSSDGALAAAVIASQGKAGLQSALSVFRVADGTLVRTLWTSTEGMLDDCVGRLDFSPDGRQLQCSSSVYDLETGASASMIGADGRYVFPVYAGQSGIGAEAQDGTYARLSVMKQTLALKDSTLKAVFAADSTGLVSLRRAARENRGQPLYAPPIFRRLSVVTLWDGKTMQIQREFYANQRYRSIAWSQDAKLFGLATADLRLDIFSR